MRLWIDAQSVATDIFIIITDQQQLNVCCIFALSKESVDGRDKSECRFSKIKIDAGNFNQFQCTGILLGMIDAKLPNSEAIAFYDVELIVRNA